MKTNQFLFISVVSLLFKSGIKAQDYSLEFGKPTQYEYELKQYPADKEAEALIIYDKGKSRFMRTDEGFHIIFERVTKIKIFTEAGLDYAEIAIPFYKDNSTIEKIDHLVGYTYNLENGQRSSVTFDPKNIYEEKVSENWYHLKFAMPGVKPGSIIEYRYRLETPRIFYLQDWDFQSKIPTFYSEYEIRMIPFYQYTWLLQGANKFDVYTVEEAGGLPNHLGSITYYENIITYGMKNVPAFRDEEFITSVEDYIIKIDFQLSSYTDIHGITTEVITTWPKLCNELIKDPDFGGYIKSSAGKSGKLFNFESLGGSTDEEKYLVVMDFIKSNFNWNGYRGYMAGKPAGKFITEKTGNTANINLFLCGMLQETGMNAYPVLISTRDHGRIKFDYPYGGLFNYVIVLVSIDGKNKLADATNNYCPDFLIPEDCINDKGLVVDKKSEFWASLSSDIQSYKTYTFKTKVSDNTDSLKIDINLKTTNYEALRLRKKYQNKYKNLEDYFNDMDFEITDSIQVENYYEKNEPFIVDCKANYPLETINNKLYISPFCNAPISKNPFTQNSRNYPIDMEYARTEVYVAQINVPEGYTAEYIPENYDIKASLIEISYETQTLDEYTLLVKGSLKLNKAVYDAGDYLKLKFYFNDIIKKFNDKIVLVKNDG